MAELAARIARLSPEQRRLLELRLAAHRAGEPSGAAAPPAPDAPEDNSGPWPLSFAQQRLWFVDQMEPGSPLYNVPAAFRLSGPLAVAALRRALGELVRRQAALRTVFTLAGGRPVQRIEPAAPQTSPPLPLLDLAALPPRRRAAESLRLLTAEARAPFDLARGPLLRCRLVRLAPGEHLMSCVLHHIVADWWSIGLLLRELAAAYQAALRGRPSPLPELPRQYPHFAVEQRHRLQGARLEEVTRYWKRRLAGAPPLLRLPVDRLRLARQSLCGAQLDCELGDELKRRLDELARRHGETPFSVALAVYHALLRHLCGQTDLVISAPVANRQQHASEVVVGNFVNTLLFRTDSAPLATFGELLRQVGAEVAAAYAHHELPLEQVIAELAPARSTVYSPLLQVGMNLLDYGFTAETAVPGLAVAPYEIDLGTAQFELNLILIDSSQGLRARFQYRTDLFDRETVAVWAECLRELLHQVVAQPCIALGELSRHLARRELRCRSAPPLPSPASPGAPATTATPATPATPEIVRRKTVRVALPAAPAAPAGHPGRRD
jgi:hypothetical protein